MNKPLVSVIIPTYNEEKNIQACLESSFKQTYSNIKLYIVDDGSTDETIAEAQKVFRRKLVGNESGIKGWEINSPGKHRGPGVARNIGGQKSRGEIIVFVDADMILDKDFINNLTKPIRSGETIGTFTKDEYVANQNNRWAKAWSVIRGFKNGRMHPDNYPDEQNVFRAILRKEFIKSGGFDTERGYDDDWSLSEKLGVKATLAKNAVIFHNNPASPKEIFEQSIWMANRKYKFGIIGKLIALIRATFPITLIVSLGLFIKHLDPFVFLAKLVSDFGIFVGLVRFFITNRTAR